MIRNRLGLPARFLMVATAVACWIPCVPAAAVGMPLVQTPPPAPGNLRADLEGTSVRLNWTASTPLPTESPVTGYRIRMYYRAQHGRLDRPRAQHWQQRLSPTCTQAPPRGTTVHYQVAAINAAGREGEPFEHCPWSSPQRGARDNGCWNHGNLTATIAGPTIASPSPGTAPTCDRREHDHRSTRWRSRRMATSPVDAADAHAHERDRVPAMWVSR